MGAPEHHRTGALAIAGDAQIDRCIENAFQFQRTVFFALFAFEHLRRFFVGLAEQIVDLSLLFF